MTEQPEPQQAPRPPLRRSKDDRVIAGVCGGLARTLGIDPIVVRVLMAAFTLAGGAGFFAYLIAWILIPDDAGASVVDNARGGGSKAGKFFIALVLAAAGLAVVSSLSPGTNDAFGFFLFVLIAVVVWQAFGHDWFNRTSVTHSGSGATPGTVHVQQGDGESVTVQSPAGTTVIRQERPSPLGRIVFNLVVVIVGVMLALNWAGITDISLRTMLSVTLAASGLGLVVSAFAGRARGLIALGVVAGLLAMPGSVHVEPSTGTQSWQPLSAAAAAENFELGAGTATLDLQPLALALEASEAVTVHAHVAVGELIVLLPSSGAAHGLVTSRVQMGSIQWPDAPSIDGFNNRHSAPYGFAEGGPVINVEATVGVGQITIEYREAGVTA